MEPDLEIPALFSLGLGEVLKGRVFDPPARKCAGSYGRMRSRAASADSTSGSWELAGVINDRPFAAFEEVPQPLADAIADHAGVTFLGNGNDDHDGDFSKTLERWGEEHLRTGKPILRVSPGSLIEIAAHESVLPIASLHRICRIARRHCDDARVARVAARPFTGKPGQWRDADGRHDYSMVPPRTIFNVLSEIGFPVEAIGGAADRFARSGITRSHRSASDAETLLRIDEIWQSPEESLAFGNLAGFNPGPGRPPSECARALEEFDDWLADFLEEIDSDDLILLAGSPGHAPGSPGALDQPREEFPILLRYDGRTGPLGVRETFADVSATLASFFDAGRHQHAEWHVGTPLIPFYRPHPSFIP